MRREQQTPYARRTRNHSIRSMYFLTDHVDPGADVTYSNFGRRSRVRDHAYTGSRPAFHRHALARRYLNTCVSAFDFTYVAMENPQIALAYT